MADDVPKDAKSLVSSIMGDIATPANPPEPQSEPPTISQSEPGAALPQSATEAKALVSSVLSKLGMTQADAAAQVEAAAADESPAAPDSDGPDEAINEEETEALIDLYFDLEEPDERDALLEQLIANPLPVVTEFFKVMLHEDEDDYMRALAAAALARRHVPEGIEALEADLEDPDEPFFFENAVKALCEVRGVNFYETLHAMWIDADCDGDRRREVMLGMESLDLDRALRDFVGLVEATTDIDTMLDDQIEVAMMAFVRHDYKEALPALRSLHQRVLAAPIDPEERQELGEFIAEGVTLLDSTA